MPGVGPAGLRAGIPGHRDAVKLAVHRRQPCNLQAGVAKRLRKLGTWVRRVRDVQFLAGRQPLAKRRDVSAGGNKPRLRVLIPSGPDSLGPVLLRVGDCEVGPLVAGVHHRVILPYQSGRPNQHGAGVGALLRRRFEPASPPAHWPPANDRSRAACQRFFPRRSRPGKSPVDRSQAP